METVAVKTDTFLLAIYALSEGLTNRSIRSHGPAFGKTKSRQPQCFLQNKVQNAQEMLGNILEKPFWKKKASGSGTVQFLSSKLRCAQLKPI